MVTLLVCCRCFSSHFLYVTLLLDCIDFVVFFVFFFFFNQKTAYDMRISDWSSDVCSSDLYARWVPARSPAAGDCDGPPGRGRSPVPAPDSASRPIVPATARPRRSASGPARASFPPAPQGQGGASSSTGGHGDC